MYRYQIEEWETCRYDDDTHDFSNDDDTNLSDSERAHFSPWHSHSDGNDLAFGSSIAQRKAEEWKLVRIEDTILQVSSEGRVKVYRDLLPSSDGFSLAGTPYRVFPLLSTNVLVHELVWWAFKGLVPEGWEVRHRLRNNYRNHIDNLDIFPSITRPLSRLQPNFMNLC